MHGTRRQASSQAGTVDETMEARLAAIEGQLEKQKSLAKQLADVKKDLEAAKVQIVKLEKEAGEAKAEAEEWKKQVEGRVQKLEESKEELDASMKKSADIAAEAKKGLGDMGDRVTKVDAKVDEKWEVMEKGWKKTTQKIEDAEGEAAKALYLIVKAEEKRVAKDSASSVVWLDCGSIARGKEAEVKHAKLKRC